MNFTIPMVEPIEQFIWKVKLLRVSIGAASETFAGTSTRPETEIWVDVDAVTGGMLSEAFVPVSEVP